MLMLISTRRKCFKLNECLSTGSNDVKKLDGTYFMDDNNNGINNNEVNLKRYYEILHVLLKTNP